MKARAISAWRWVRRQKWWVQALIAFGVYVVIAGIFAPDLKKKATKEAAAATVASAPATTRATTTGPASTATPATTVAPSTTEAPVETNCPLMASDGTCITETTAAPNSNEPTPATEPASETTVNQLVSPTDNGEEIVRRVSLLLLDEPDLADDEQVQGRFSADYYEGTVGVDRTLILGMSFGPAAEDLPEVTPGQLARFLIAETTKRATAMMHAADLARQEGVEFDRIQMEISAPYIGGNGGRFAFCCETVLFRADVAQAMKQPNPWCEPWAPFTLAETPGAKSLRVLVGRFC